MKSNAKKRYAMVIDAGKCFDCKACMIACKVENQVPDGFWRNWVKNDSTGTKRRTQFQPGQCMQCQVPSCVAACPVGATFKNRDGVIEITPEKCIGCGNCLTACPYGARYRDPKLRKADKCDFCMHRLAKGKLPACVETCPTKARTFGDLNDPESEVSRLMKTGKPFPIPAPDFNTQPNLFYMPGTTLVGWAVAPSLPGERHMPDSFWRGE